MCSRAGAPEQEHAAADDEPTGSTEPRPSCCPASKSGGPISDKRLVSISNDAVTFRYKDHRDGTQQLMKLAPHDFLSRWMEHVPPRGLRMIRRSGLYANSLGDVRKRIGEQLAAEHPAPAAAPPVVAAAGVTPLDPEQCPVCNTCVKVRFVSRFVLEGSQSEVWIAETAACLTRPP